ncbi:endonuclease/exonuclease/phosphatase family protein [Rariglobus hedericola]|uniref:Endonuclease/exonuclease/phosphatase family protein n=1 Tax=Rariglobus hedericola TaxID=2597822 RepID=A0A556QMU1_9BACT|nr:endonuclease/exonuclease/phosphatase family protein [Rariglobus hedericola]TSJ77958.1 endonuclease/exonuclease/phosphatase family protein [Rariglobus hedericola]
MNVAVLRLCGVLLSGWLLASSSQAEPLTVATYNIENYTIADRTVEGVYRKEYPKPEADKAALRAVIRQMNADVLALQEIGGAPFLAELQRDLKHEGVDYPHAVVLEAEDKDRMIAVLSKRPLVQVVRHQDLAFKYLGGVMKVRRGLLEVRVADDKGEVAVFVVHLKSRFTERPDDPGAALQRAGEAVAVRDRVLAVFPKPDTARFLIVGDFNDGRTARPVRAMLERGETPITTWLPAADERGHVWSHFFRKDDSYSRVDHVLVSAGLLPRVLGGAGRIQDSPEVGKASDHRPVVVVLE